MPVPVTPVSLSPVKAPAASSQQESPSSMQMDVDLMLNLQQKSFVERSMYKRELCKNWAESGFCRYGQKCQYAHGLEELSENH